jgi:hypothetical protein
LHWLLLLLLLLLLGFELRASCLLAVIILKTRSFFIRGQPALWFSYLCFPRHVPTCSTIGWDGSHELFALAGLNCDPPNLCLPRS